MYIPPRYRNENRNDLLDFIRQHGFGLLITGGDRPLATHIPLVLECRDGRDFLVGHVARGNPQWKTFAERPTALAVFQGPHSYISSSWYSIESVSTWNYVAVHARGPLRVMEGTELLAALSRLTNKYEQGMEQPVFLGGLPPKMIHREMRGIVGFEMEIQELHGARKLSQNRNDQDHARIIQELKQQGNSYASDIAEEMRKERGEE